MPHDAVGIHRTALGIPYHIAPSEDRMVRNVVVVTH